MNKQTENAMAKTIKPKTPGTFDGLKSDGVQSILNQMLPAIRKALPKHITPERMLQMATVYIVQNPQIAKCSQSSIVGAIMQCSILGFKPVSALGQVYFVPYGKHVQFQIGYRGHIDLARRSGQLIDIYAEVVREGDLFEQKKGLHRDLIHEPGDDPDAPITHAYAVAKYKDGGYNFIVLNKKEIEKLRMRNAMQGAAPKGAWLTDYDAMAKAKAIKQLERYMPKSEEYEKAVLADEAVLDVNKFNPDGTGIKEEEINIDLEVEDQGPAEVVEENVPAEIQPPGVSQPDKPAETPPPPPKEEKAQKPKAEKPAATKKREVVKHEEKPKEVVAPPPAPVEIPKDPERKIVQSEKGVTITITDGPTYDATIDDYKKLIAGEVTDNDLLDKDLDSE